jgi:hypothetical protein
MASSSVATLSDMASSTPAFQAWRHLPLNCILHFRGTENFLHTFLAVDQSIITRIRHVRVRAFPFPLYASGQSDYYPTYYAANALTLLPGLCLDTLVVEDCWHGFGMGDGWRDVTTYFDIESLLQSDAWKELTYITPCTDFLASGYDHRQKRVTQPESWDAQLKERDGEESGAQVQMMIVPYKQEKATGHERTEDGRIMQPWTAKPGHEVIENFRIAAPDQDLKGEVRIIARRGKRAIAVQTGMSQKQTWKELKGKTGGFTPEGTYMAHMGSRVKLTPATDWTPYYNDMADAIGWIYGGWGRRAHLADQALSS